MARTCRDCPACTRSGVVRLLYLVLVVWWLWLFRWAFTMWFKNCPQCGHMLKRHARRADGSFRD